MTEWILLYALLGAVVGFIAGLLGVGGGGILVPALTAMFLAQGLPVDKVLHLALGTSMACIVFTSIASLRAHQRKSAIIWPLVSRMSIGVVLGTFLATFIAAKLSAQFIAVFFSTFMAFAAYQTFFKSGKVSKQRQPGNIELFLSGSGIGAVSALVSIGGGSLTVPYLTARNIDVRKAIGTSAAIGLPISVSGAIGYFVNGWSVDFPMDWVFGYVYLPAVLMVAAFSFITAPLGAHLAHKLPTVVLKKCFAVLLFGLSIKMLLSVI